jgi:DNA excision repair protein ERCC-2
MATVSRIKSFSFSVRDFAQPVPRTGSIDPHSGYGPASQLGQAAHQRIQAERALADESYSAEMWLSHDFIQQNFRFSVSGRADGVYTGLHPIIEEIKTSFDIAGLHRTLLEQPFHPHWLQLATYVELYAKKFHVRPQARLLLASLRHGDEMELDLTLSVDDYSSWLQRRLDLAVIEATEAGQIKKRRKKTSAALEFPFPQMRPKQNDVIEKVDFAFREQRRLLLQAPTGLGKTASVLFPTVREALGRGQRVVYVTPKNSQHAVAEDGLQRLQATGAKLKYASLTAKAKICMKEEPICNSSYCEYAKDHYTKMSDNDVVKKALKKRKLTATTFTKLAQEYQVCPFELSLEVLRAVDVIVADYNYVFSPQGLLARLTDATAPKHQRSNLIVDEVHNLPDRACTYFSATLSSKMADEAALHIDSLPPGLNDLARQWLERWWHFIAMHVPGDSLEPHLVSIDKTGLEELQGAAGLFLGRYFASDLAIEPTDVFLRLNRSLMEFSELAGMIDETFFTSALRTPDQGVLLKITCCDASRFLRETYEAFYNVVGFSATLKPFGYYARLCGLESKELLTEEFPSPFKAENRKIIIIPQISTKFRDREANVQKIGDAILRIANCRSGHYLVFAPSFAFMEQICQSLAPCDFEIFCQPRQMTSRGVKVLLESLGPSAKPQLIFAVQGGVLAEGVDYLGRNILGAFIVGPGLPQFDFEREYLRQYFERHYGSGFDYAYTYPAMTKVIQSAGRVIRSETDRGLIVLMDRRFLQTSYAQSMPSGWFETSAQELVSNEILKSVHKFWESSDAT